MTEPAPARETRENVDLLSEAASRGHRYAREGRLREIRERIGLSLGAMAEVYGVTTRTYRGWERREKGIPWRAHAERVADVVERASRIIDDLDADGVAITDLVPLHVAASRAGMAGEVALERYRRDPDRFGLDLGILGTWVYADRVCELGGWR